MATVLDSLGRTVEKAGVTLEEIKGLIATLVQGPLGKPTKPEGAAASPTDTNADTIEEIRDILEEYTTDFKTESDELKGYVNEAVGLLRDLAQAREATKDDRKAKKQDKAAKEKDTKKEPAAVATEKAVPEAVKPEPTAQYLTEIVSVLRSMSTQIGAEKTIRVEFAGQPIDVSKPVEVVLKAKEVKMPSSVEVKRLTLKDDSVKVKAVAEDLVLKQLDELTQPVKWGKLAKKDFTAPELDEVTQPVKWGRLFKKDFTPPELDAVSVGTKWATLAKTEFAAPELDEVTQPVRWGKLFKKDFTAPELDPVKQPVQWGRLAKKGFTAPQLDEAQQSVRMVQEGQWTPPALDKPAIQMVRWGTLDAKDFKAPPLDPVVQPVRWGQLDKFTPPDLAPLTQHVEYSFGEFITHEFEPMVQRVVWEFDDFVKPDGLEPVTVPVRWGILDKKDLKVPALDMTTLPLQWGDPGAMPKTPAPPAGGTEASPVQERIAASTEGLKQVFETKGSGYTHDTHVVAALEDMHKTLTKIWKCVCKAAKAAKKEAEVEPEPEAPEMKPEPAEAAAKAAGKGGGGGGGKKGKVETDDGGGGGGGGGKTTMRAAGGWPMVGTKEDLDRTYQIWQLVNTMEKTLGKMEKSVLGWGNTLDKIFGGVIEKERQFTQDIRKVAYETAGATKETRGLQRAFEDIGTTVHVTGADRTAFQERYIKMLKMGIKDQKVAHRLSLAQLNTETQLGLKAGELGDTFGTWHTAFRMTEMQIADMGRGMRDIARYTGLTGENLAKAIKSGEQFIQQLRNAATLTAAAAKNILELAANAQKLGIEKAMNPLMSAMTSTTNLLMEASTQTKNLLFAAAGRVGRTADLLQGTVLQTKQGMKDMAKGLEGLLKQFGVDSLEAIDQLSDEAKMRLNISLKAAFGVELGELRNVVTALKESGKTFADRLGEINKKRQQNLTLEEKAALLEEERRLKQSKSLEIMTALDEAAKGAKDMGQALEKFGTRRKDFEGDLNAMGASWSSNADAAKAAINQALSSVNEGLKKAGKAELKIDSSEIEKALQDPVAFRELSAKISKAEQTSATAQKSQVDHLSEMSQKLAEINDAIRNVSQGIISGLLSGLGGKILIIAAVLGGLVLGIGTMVANLMVMKNAIESGFRMFFGKQDTANKELDEANSKLAEIDKKQDAAKQTTTAVTKGNETLNQIVQAMGRMESLLTQIRDCVCRDKPQAEPAAAAAKAAAPEAKPKPEPAQAAVATAAPVAKAPPTKAQGVEDPTVVKAKLQAIQKDDKLSATEKKMMTRDIVLQRKEIVMQKKDIKSQKQGDKIQNAQQALVKDQQKTPGVGVPPSAEGMGFDINAMLASAGEMKKIAAVLAVVLAGVLVLGAAVLLGAKLIKGLNIDLGSVMMAAGLIAGVGAAAAAIIGGIIALTDKLEGSDVDAFSGKANTLINFVKKNKATLLKVAAAAILITPVLVLVGVAIIKLTEKILKGFGVSLGSIAETAITAGAAIAAIVAAVSTIMEHLPEAAEKLQEVSKNPIIQNPKAFIKEVWKGALALLLIVPAVVFLAAAILRMSQLILKIFAIDAATAFEIGKTVAAVMIAAGIIGAASIGAALGLKAFGAYITGTAKLIPLMLLGAKYLLIFTPAVVALAGALLWMSRIILGAFGLTPKVAMETGAAVASVMISAGLIAAAALGAAIGLKALGAWSVVASLTIPLVWAGAKALLLYTPAILLLAGAILTMANAILGAFELDEAKAAKIGKAVAAVLFSAALIAAACLAAAVGLKYLGLWSVVASLTLPLVWAGAKALLLYTPAILLLGSVLLKMAEVILGAFGLNEAIAKKIGRDVAAVLMAAAFISMACLAAAIGLKYLGAWSVVAALTIPLVWAGAKALLIFTPAMLFLAGAILKMSEAILGAFGLDEAKANKIAADVKAVLGAAGTIAWALLKQTPLLMILGLLFPIAKKLMIFMFKGAAAFAMLSAPVLALAAAIVGLALIIDKLFGMEKAIKATQGLEKLIDAASSVAWTVMKLAPALAILGALSIFAGIAAGLMWLGAGAFMLMAAPVVALTVSLLRMGQALTTKYPPEKAKQIADGVKTVVDAGASVAKAINDMKGQLIWLGLLSFLAKFIAWALEKGAKAFFTMAKPVVTFTVGLMRMGQAMIVAAGGMKRIKAVTEGIKAIAEAIEAVGKVMDTLMKVILPLTRRKWFGLFGSNKLEDLAAAIPQFERSFDSIIEFVKQGIIVPLKRLGRDGKKIKQATEQAKLVASLMESVGKVMDVLAKVIIPLTTRPSFLFFSYGSSPLQKLTAAIPQFEAAFATIVGFVKTGVVNPINRAFRDVKKVKQATQIAVAIADAMNAIGPMIGNIANVVTDLTARPSFLFFSYGKSKLQKLQEAIPQFEGAFGAIVQFVKNGVIGPITRAFPNIKKVAPVVQIAKSIGEGVLAIAQTLDIMANKLAPLAERETTGILWWRSEKPSKLEKLVDLIPKFQGPFAAIVSFVRDGLIGTVTTAFPDIKKVEAVAPIIKGVGDIVSSIATMMDDLVNKLLPMTEEETSGFWFWKSEEPSKFDKLIEAIPTIRRVFQAVISFVKWGLVEPVNRAFSDVKGVEQTLKIIETIGKSVTAVGEIIESLTDIGNQIQPWYSWIFRSADQSTPLERMIPIIGRVFWRIAAFVKWGIVTPISFFKLEGLPRAVKTLEQMSKAIQLVGQIIEDLQDVASLFGQWEMYAAYTYRESTKLEKMIPVLSRVFWGVSSFVRYGLVVPVNAYLGGIDLKATTKTMMWMAKMIEQVPPILENLGEALKMISPDGRYLSYIGAQIQGEMSGRWKDWYKNFFTGMAKFIREGIVDPISTQLTDAKKVINVAKILVATATMLDKLPDVMENLGTALKMLSPDGNVLQSHLATQIINEMQGRWKGWYKWVFTGMAKFIREGIVDPIYGELKDVKKIVTVAKVLVATSKMMEKIPAVMQNLGSALRLLSPDGDVLQSHLATQIINEMQGKWKGWYRWVFTGMAKFIREGIVDPIFTELGDVKKLQTVAKALVAAATMMEKLPPVMQKLGDALRLLSPDGNVLQSALVTQIQGEMAGRWKGWYARQFTDIAKFINEGIVQPVFGQLDVKQVTAVAKILVSAATMMSKLPTVMQKLGDALRLLSPDYIGQSELVTQIQRWSGWYARQFTAIAIFMREGIIVPILTELPDPKTIGMAARILTAMAKIITLLPKVITGISRGLIPLIDSGMNIERDAPMEVILAQKDKFKNWFTQCAVFMRDGIVVPILTELPDAKTISMAARILMAMAKIITLLPRVIIGMSRNLIPLIDSGMNLERDAPMEVIMQYKDQFSRWFTQVAIFMREGIVVPILTELPDPKTIGIAARILMGMMKILVALPKIIRGISRLFIPLDPTKALSESPVGVIATNAALFEDWFWAVAEFMRVGLITPIMYYFPSADEVKEVQKVLNNMADVISMIPQLLNYLQTELLSMLEVGWDGQSKIGKLLARTALFALYFYGIASALRYGIIEPIRQGFPTTEEVDDVADRLNGLIGALNLLPKFLDDLSVKMIEMSLAQWWNQDLTKDTARFSAYFYGISSALVGGVINPIRYWFPSTDEIEEIIGRLDGMDRAIVGARQMLDTVSQQLVPLADGWWWYSPQLSNLAANARRFASYFTGIGMTLVYGMVKPVQWYWPSSEALEEVNNQLLGMEKIIKTSRSTLDTVSREIVPLADGWWWYSPELSRIGRNVRRFASYFEGIAWTLSDGIAGPIRRYFPPAAELQEVVTRLELLTDIITKIKDVLSTFSEVVQELAAIDVDFSQMKELELEELGEILGSITQIEIPETVEPAQVAVQQTPQEAARAARREIAAGQAPSAPPVVQPGDMEKTLTKVVQKQQQPSKTIKAEGGGQGALLMSVKNAAKTVADSSIMAGKSAKETKIIPQLSKEAGKAVPEVVGQVRDVTASGGEIVTNLGQVSQRVGQVGTGGEQILTSLNTIGQRMVAFVPVFEQLMTTASDRINGAIQRINAAATTPAPAPRPQQSPGASQQMDQAQDQLVQQTQQTSDATQTLADQATQVGSIYTADTEAHSLLHGILAAIQELIGYQPDPSEAMIAHKTQTGIMEAVTDSSTALRGMAVEATKEGSLYVSDRATQQAVGEVTSTVEQGNRAAQEGQRQQNQRIQPAMNRAQIQPAMRREQIQPAMTREQATRPAMTRDQIRPAIQNIRPRETPEDRLRRAQERRESGRNRFTERRDRIRTEREARRESIAGIAEQRMEAARAREEAAMPLGRQDLSMVGRPQTLAVSERPVPPLVTGSVGTAGLTATTMQQPTLAPQQNQAQTAAPPPTTVTQIGADLQRDRAAAAPTTAQITSPELGHLASSSEKQESHQAQMVHLLTQLLNVLKPAPSRSAPLTGSGMAAGDTSARDIQQKPINTYRWGIGRHMQSAGKAVLNIGANTL